MYGFGSVQIILDPVGSGSGTHVKNNPDPRRCWWRWAGTGRALRPSSSSTTRPPGSWSSGSKAPSPSAFCPPARSASTPGSIPQVSRAFVTKLRSDIRFKESYRAQSEGYCHERKVSENQCRVSVLTEAMVRIRTQSFVFRKFAIFILNLFDGLLSSKRSLQTVERTSSTSEHEFLTYIFVLVFVFSFSVMPAWILMQSRLETLPTTISWKSYSKPYSCCTGCFSEIIRIFVKNSVLQ